MKTFLGLRQSNQNNFFGAFIQIHALVVEGVK